MDSFKLTASCVHPWGGTVSQDTQISIGIRIRSCAASGCIATTAKFDTYTRVYNDYIHTLSLSLNARKFARFAKHFIWAKEQQWNLIAHLPLARFSLSIFPANMACLYGVYDLPVFDSIDFANRSIPVDCWLLFSANCLGIDFKVADWLCKSVYRWINCYNQQYVYVIYKSVEIIVCHANGIANRVYWTLVLCGVCIPNEQGKDLFTLCNFRCQL